MKLFISCLLLVIGIANAQKKMDRTGGNCGETVNVKAGERVYVTAAGDAPSCTLTVKTQVIDNCDGVCINFYEKNFASCHVSLTVEGSRMTEVFNCTHVPAGPWCTKESMMTLKLVETAEYDQNTEGYSFNAAVYERCTNENSGRSPTFEEAADSLAGYHLTEEADSRQHLGFVTGICLGFGLASIFLVVLLAAWCYVKHNPNRGDCKTEDDVVTSVANPPQLQTHVVTKF